MPQMPPTADEQIQFLVNIQRLLDEGQFTASYKFALLLALADLSVEVGDDSGAPLTLSSAAIAEKFIQYYWRQALPYPAPENTRILQQNPGQQAAIVRILHDAHQRHGDSLAAVKNRKGIWRGMVTAVAAVVRAMPLRYLQNVDGGRLDFLYPESKAVIELRPGVAYCLSKFHPLISEMVRAGWSRLVRQRNPDVLGEITDLHEFLFGSERVLLAKVRPVLLGLQDGHCFYCPRVLTSTNTHVDHFISWARYPVDLGHNFVLADSQCNGAKRDRLPASVHLAAWAERNFRYGDQIAEGLKAGGFISELGASRQVPQWAYSQTEAAKGLTWLRADVMEPLGPGWREYFHA
jgi:5-methylcytosine-specific restriction endonuclease McrA